MLLLRLIHKQGSDNLSSVAQKLTMVLDTVRWAMVTIIMWLARSCDLGRLFPLRVSSMQCVVSSLTHPSQWTIRWSLYWWALLRVCINRLGWHGWSISHCYYLWWSPVSSVTHLMLEQHWVICWSWPLSQRVWRSGNHQREWSLHCLTSMLHHSVWCYANNHSLCRSMVVNCYSESQLLMYSTGCCW